jgi:glycosyltransferase involved in cell wall biosynthesis
MAKRTLLYISTWIPRCPGLATPMRAAHHLKALSGLFDVTLAIVGDHGNEAEILEHVTPDVKRACVSVVIISQTPRVTGFLRRIPHHRLRVLFEAFLPTPLLFVAYPPAVTKLARRLSGRHFHAVHCFRLNTGLLRLLKRHGVTFDRSVLDLDSYESQAEFRSSKTFRALQRPALSRLNAIKWWVLESLLVPHFDDVLVCAEYDRERLRKRFPGSRWHVVPNVVAEPPEYDRPASDRFTFLFVGQLGYLPNWDAVLFFSTEVLPTLRRNAPGKFRVLVVGSTGGDLERLAAIQEIQVAIDVPEVGSFYAEADAVIVPLRGGGGTRVKILEAFSYALPVISTTIGAEGLDVTPGSDIVIADGAEAFAAQCVRVWENGNLRLRIARAGNDLWRRKYSPPALTRALRILYHGNEDADIGRTDSVPSVLG